MSLSVPPRRAGLDPGPRAVVTGRRFVQVACRVRRPAEEDSLAGHAQTELLRDPGKAAGESAEIEIACDFEPDRLVVDPDLKVLMLRRDHATADL